MGLRTRLKNRLRNALGQPQSGAQPMAASPPPAPAPAPSPPPAVASPPPQKTAKPATPKAAVDAPPAPETPSPKAISPEKVARHLERARKGVLTFVAGAGGRASLADMHDHSERRYFIGHQKFSQMMEGLVDEGLLNYDHAEGVGELTDLGREYIA